MKKINFRDVLKLRFKVLYFTMDLMCYLDNYLVGWGILFRRVPICAIEFWVSFPITYCS